MKIEFFESRSILGCIGCLLFASALLGAMISPASAGWLDWAENHAREQKVTELKEYYVHLNDVEGLSEWRLVATDRFHLILTWQSQPATYREELQRAALVGTRETDGEFIVVSLQSDPSSTDKPDLLCKVTAAKEAIKKWEGLNCGQEKIEFE